MPVILHASTSRHKEWGGNKRYIRIVVHDTLREFRQASTDYRPETDWSDAVGGFCSPAYRERYDKENGVWVNTTDKHFAGLMRLARPEVTTEVVVHECLHASAAIYRLDVKPRIKLGTMCGDNEEHMAYILGDLTSTVAWELTKADLWYKEPSHVIPGL